MSSILVESNINALATKFKKKPEHVRLGVKEGLDESANQTVRQEKALLMPHSKRGSRGILGHIKVIPTSQYSRSVGPVMDEDYPYFLEKGRKGFTAKGLRTGAPEKGSFFAGSNMGAIGHAKALRFEYKGKMIFRKKVGPAKAVRYVEKTHSSMKVMFPRIMLKFVNEALQ